MYGNSKDSPSKNEDVKIVIKSSFTIAQSGSKSFMDDFRFIFISFYLVGIEVQETEDYASIPRSYRVCKKTTIRYAVRCCLTNFIFVIFTLKILAKAYNVTIGEEIRNQFPILIIGILKVTLYISVYRKRRHILKIMENLNQELKMCPKCNLRKEKYSLVAFFTFATLFCVVWYAIDFHFRCGRRIIHQCLVGVLLLKPFISCFIEINDFLFYFVGNIILPSFIMFYMLVCILSRIIFQHIRDNLGLVRVLEDFQKLVTLHEHTLNNLEYFDKNFSFSFFITILLTMIGIFRCGYSVAFIDDNPTLLNAYSISSMFLYMLYQLLLMIAGSITNEATNDTSNVLKNRYNKDFKSPKLEVDFSQNSLTIWKIYKLDRSLIISSFGTLLTFGILLGTLGK
ncbi:hypothetical protein AVEN_198638-1 [Araneus ventricosus]|uniref:Gustatory receptor n=1 Tax=Araneus ventricosus TaxID=182803 RepID=A0A4Y2TET9_ARAVE|nr:hypothetical protein AVEN_109245-1 [Araneus ventricosus]GBN99164.1 hypothetical protein AVEN_198638-1 [Araneus ventricosus]